MSILTRPRLPLLFLFLLSVLSGVLRLPVAANASIRKKDNDDTVTRTSNDKKCGVYFAPSTIPGAGMGIFAGHYAYEEGDFVTQGDIVIPQIELEWHNDHETYSWLWDEYVWSGGMFDGLDQEIDGDAGLTLCSGGMGAAVNCRLNLVNAADSEESFQISTSGVSSESPGAGAFTPFHGRRFQATTEIPPGMEFYVSYGDNYFATRSAYKTVPLKGSYKRADYMMDKFQKLQNKSKIFQDPEKGTRLAQSLWDLVLNEWPFKTRAVYAMPANISEIPKIMSTGGTALQDYNSSIRSLEWLEENGQCMDNIKDGVSAIPYAGRGAFANRFIPAGGLVAPAPLIHLGNRSRLIMYDTLVDKEDTSKLKRDVNKPIHHQLLLNYCFGHRDSSLLLCPYGLLTALINHSPTPNTKIVWAQDLRHPEWKNESHLEWYDESHSGLSFDFVAIRDIEEDEEILIDYGNEWEEAWQKHVATFDTPRRNYTPAFDMNSQPDFKVKTIYEVDYENIEGIYTFCRKTMVDIALGMEDAIDEEDEDEVSIEVWDKSEPCYPCRVVHRNDETNRYIAEIFQRESMPHPIHDWDIQEDFVEYVLFDVPKETFFFHDAPYQRDHHQPWSFRHDMRIPDEMFPDAWKNLLHGEPSDVVM